MVILQLFLPLNTIGIHYSNLGYPRHFPVQLIPGNYLIQAPSIPAATGAILVCQPGSFYTVLGSKAMRYSARPGNEDFLPVRAKAPKIRLPNFAPTACSGAEPGLPILSEGESPLTGTVIPVMDSKRRLPDFIYRIPVQQP